MPFRCRDCRKRFSVRTGTVMQSSKLGFQTWLVAMYLLTTSLKGVSLMKLHRDLGVTQKTAWHLAHRLREMWRRNGIDPFAGPVEADETYIGGKPRTCMEPSAGEPCSALAIVRPVYDLMVTPAPEYAPPAGHN